MSLRILKFPLAALLLLALAALLLLALAAPVAQAEGERIVISSESVTSSFPEGVNFNLSLESESPIEDVRVYYRAQGADTTSYGKGEFTPGAQTQVVFFLDTSVGGEGGNITFIPPGAVFHYSFEVTNEAGETLKTEEKQFVYTDSRFEWESVSQGPLTIFYYGPTETRAQAILDASLQATVNMASVLGLPDVEHINIVAYNNYRHMQAALPPRAQTTREGLVTQGQAFTEIRVLLVLGTDPKIEGIASHEVTHVLVDDAAGRAYGILPAWLNEGLAEFGNVSPSESYDNALLYGIYTRRLKPLSYLSSFVGDPNDVVISYGHSRSVVAYLINRYGGEKMAQLMLEIEQTFSLDQAMLNVYGFDQDGLDAEWRTQVGLRPFAEQDLATDANPPPAAAPAPAAAEDPGEHGEAVGDADPSAEDDGPRRSPGCSRDSRVDAAAAYDPFFFLLLGAPALLLTVRRWRRGG